MKIITLFFLCFFTLSSYGNSLAYLLSNPNNWSYGQSVCYQQVNCFNGTIAHCTAYAQNYGTGYGGNACRSIGIPGEFVMCEGYAQQYDQFGNLFWGQVQFSSSCY